MDEDAENDGTTLDESARGIAGWARKYAQNRTLPVIVSLVVFLGAFVLLSGLSWLAARAYGTGQHLLAVAILVPLGAFVVWWIWFCTAGAARLLPPLTERLYRREGQVAAGGCGEQAPGGNRSDRWVIAAFGLCILASVALGLVGVIPIRYMQPVSALYCVPFLCYIGIRTGKAGSPFMFLWPALYGIHAILIVAGAPVYFEKWDVLNMLIPAIGYGIVAALAGHIYSRVALRRLRTLARSPLGAGEEGGEGL